MLRKFESFCDGAITAFFVLWAVSVFGHILARIDLHLHMTMLIKGIILVTRLDQWQQQFSLCHKTRKHDQVKVLAQLINDPPHELWGPELSIEQSQGLGCWLDGCARMYQYHLEQAELEAAYSYLCLAQGRLEQVISRAEVDQNIRLCCCRRLEQVMVLIVEFCKKQHGKAWRAELSNQIESHIKFLTLYPLNEAPIPILKPSRGANKSA
ncbi:hypothetical protein VIN01S_29680 [Vibrio inusitatus NBRC 102082]|uniref:Uncharacterized protein n=1 Tax=Vibrio inusitatus NBRC 102082 TaxID=1219070 RepID=A0A4Y3I120_9VIBR|nr:hypothetical protein VIN01S_29680 [Vibrio inusitatus NBRC 102082]